MKFYAIFLQAKTQEGTYSPFSVMYGKTLLVADIGEVEHHRKTEKLVTYLANNGTTTCDNDLREMVMKGNISVIEGHRSVTIYDESGQCRNV